MTARDHIESDLGAMLARRADDTDPATLDVPRVTDLDLLRLVPVAPSYQRRSARRRSLATIGVGAVAAMVVVVVALRASDNAPKEVNAGVPTTMASPLGSLPVGFDPKSANPFFTGEGTAEEVAMAYLRDRLWADSTHDVRVTAMPTVDDVVTVPWTKDVGTSGFVVLRRDDAAWDVVAATTDGVDLSGLVLQSGRVQGIVRGSELLLRRQAMSADVLGLDAKPVPAAPFPEGVPGAEYLYATAARGYVPELPIDVVVPDEPVVVRIHLVGGALLSVSEVRFDPPSLLADELWGRTFISRSISAGGAPVAIYDNVNVMVRFEQRATGGVMQWRADCNSMGGSIVLDGGRITVGEAGGTTGGCAADSAERDRWIGEFFGAGPAWKLTTQGLILETKDATILLVPT